MSYSELNQLTRAEELFDAGKLDEARELLDNLIQLEGVNLQQKGYYQFLKGLTLLYQGKYEETITFGEQMFKENQKFNQNLHSVDGLLFILFGLIEFEKFEEALEVIEQSEDLLKFISHISQKDLLPRKARINIIKGYINFRKGNLELAENCYEWTLGLKKELGNSFEIVLAYLNMAAFCYNVKSEIDIAIEYINKAKSIAKEIKFNLFWIANCHMLYGVIYANTGEFELSLEHYMKNLAILKQLKNKWYLSGILNNIGYTNGIIGNYDLALKYLEESLILWERNPTHLVNILSNLISMALVKGDIELAQQYYNQLENLCNEKKDRYIVAMYQYSKALMLKRSSRIRDKAKVEELLKQVIETENFSFAIIINALVHLCDLLLSEFRLNNNIEVLDEVNHYIAQLLTIAEKSHSYLYFCETFILQAKLALINLDMKAARRFLTQAQKIAEKYGIRRLAIKISNEHDELLRQLKMWENLKESETSFPERMKLARLNEQMEHMIRKRRIEVPELSDEEPVLLLIVSEGGIPFFSQSFIEDKSFEDHLFGGFFTAINSFINEKFSEGLERASFGEHTLLMNSISPFLMCYVYKGQSYSAQNRIKSFINEIQSNKEMWDTFEKFYQMNKKIHMKDIPSLEQLITKIFIEKSEAINV